MKNKVFLKTFGWQMNVRDSEVICGLLRNEGYRIVDESDMVDVVVFVNTCSGRQHAEDRAWLESGGKKGKSQASDCAQD